VAVVEQAMGDGGAEEPAERGPEALSPGPDDDHQGIVFGSQRREVAGWGLVGEVIGPRDAELCEGALD
jgi:hypothetical protein